MNFSSHQQPTIKQTALIGSASGWGAQLRSTEKGAEFMKKSQLLASLTNKEIEAFWSDVVLPTKRAFELDLPSGPKTLPYIIPQLESLAKRVDQAINNKQFPTAIGGDHVMAVGTFSGAIKALDARENFGLIWIDAHMDAHTPATSPSYAYHGMPVASLLGHGEEALVNLYGPGPKIRPQDLVLIGIRSFESGELHFLRESGVKVYYCPEVLSRGFEGIIQEAIAHVSKNTKAFGVSIDLDAFDPKYAPGVGSAEPHGLIPQDVLPHLHHVRSNSKFSALEITEFNPDLDHDNLTADLIKNLLQELLPTRRS